MAAPRYRAAPHRALIAVPMDAFTAIFHRPSGTTHLLVEPAPQLLDALAEGPATLDELLARLSDDFDLADADRAALTARLDELAEAGLVALA